MIRGKGSRIPNRCFCCNCRRSFTDGNFNRTSRSLWLVLPFYSESSSTAASFVVVIVMTAMFSRLMTSTTAAQMTSVVPTTESGSRMAVFAAFRPCGLDVHRPEVVNVSIMAAVRAATNESGIAVGVDVFDSCDAVQAVAMLNWAAQSDSPYSAVAGPGVSRLCDFATYIYQQASFILSSLPTI